MLEFADSFDHYSNAQFLKKWTAADMSGVDGIGAWGRFGTNGYAAGGRRAIFKTLPGGAKSERIIGFAAKCFFPPGFGWNLLTLTDAGSNQIELRYAVTGSVMEVTRNGTAIAGATGTTLIWQQRWHYFELHFVHHNSTGELELRVDGNVEFALTGLDTQATANATSDSMWFFDRDIGSTGCIIDDVVVLDSVDSGVVGAPNNDFLGDIKVKAIFPNGNGTYSDLLGSDLDSTDNYLLVDEVTPDDATYVGSSDVGDKDTYEYEDPNEATIYGVQICPYARKTDAGARSIATISKLGATEVDSADIALAADYAYSFDIREANPDGDQWTTADVSAAENGIKVTV